MSEFSATAPSTLLGALWVHPRVQARYPRMGPLDVAVWRACVAQHLVPGNLVAYDVLLGGGRTPPPGMSPDEARLYRELTQLRADVCAQRGRTVWAVEVKPAVDVKAIGQALSYAALARDALPAGWKVVPAVAVWECDEDFECICEAYGISIWQADRRQAMADAGASDYPDCRSAGDILHSLGC